MKSLHIGISITALFVLLGVGIYLTIPTHRPTSDIEVSLPFENAVVGKDFSVVGKARGTWYFEGSFPIRLTTPAGIVLAEGIAKAEGEWMTENFVPFKADLHVGDQSYIGPAVLTLRKDNPSGLPEHDASLSRFITVEY